jgi:hypothetical protein
MACYRDETGVVTLFKPKLAFVKHSFVDLEMHRGLTLPYSESKVTKPHWPDP